MRIGRERSRRSIASALAAVHRRPGACRRAPARASSSDASAMPRARAAGAAGRARPRARHCRTRTSGAKPTTCPHRRCRSVSPTTCVDAGERQADGVREHLRHDRRGALADLLRAVVEEERARRPVAGAARRASSTDWRSRCCRCRTTCSAMPAPRRVERRARRGVERAAPASPRSMPAAARRGTRAGRRSRPAPGRSASRRRRRAHCDGGTRAGRCRSARRARRGAARRAASTAARRSRGTHRPTLSCVSTARVVRAHVRHAIRAARVDRHAIGDGRAPRRVGAGVEVAGEVEGDEAAPSASHAARARMRGGMALGARLPSTRAARRRGAPARPSCQRGDREQRLQPTGRACRRSRRRCAGGTMRTRSGRDAEDLRDLVAIHVRRLRAGEERRSTPPSADARVSA